MVNISINITPPAGMTDAEAVRLYTAGKGYVQGQGETRAQFAKRVIADEIRATIRQQRRAEAELAAGSAVPDNVTVD